jgi:hypothetical protein
MDLVDSGVMEMSTFFPNHVMLKLETFTVLLFIRLIQSLITLKGQQLK